jgi:AbrB family looped-hinge helix DNA binding protein
MLILQKAYKKEDGCMKSIGLKVSKRGYIVLPARIRRQMNIKSGTTILLSKEENRLILQPVVSFTDRLSGLTAQKFGKAAVDVQKYIDEERKDRSK